METICPDRKTPACRRAAPAVIGPLRSLTLPVSDVHYPSPSPSFKSFECFVDEFETNLRCFETAAKEKFCEAISALPDVKLEGWFIGLLDSHIIPSLTRIGFDTSFARSLFQIAACGWQQMSPISDKCLCFLPVLTRSIREIRKEMVSKAGHPQDGFLHAAGTRHRDHPNVGEGTAGPQVSSSWIILPRVYRFLEQWQSQYLPGYLSCLERETHPEFRKILARIIIEFTGNYTYKYRSRSFSRCRVDAALFYGCAAMFWKNLRNPPPGFEDDLIFNHCLRWIKLFQSRCTHFTRDMTAVLEPMEAYRQQILPARSAFGKADQDLWDWGRFLVTLRHGQPGVQAVIAYLMAGINSATENPADGAPYTRVPAALNDLFQTIKKRLPQETPAFQNSVRNFLGRLKENYASARINDDRTAGDSAAQGRFVFRRVMGLVDGLSASLSV